MAGATRGQENLQKPYTVLVVDDEPDTLESVRALLADEPRIRVLMAPGGYEAIETLEQESVDLVLADYRMPRMNGLELLLRLKEIAPTVDRILFTAYADLHVSIRAINEGRVSRFFTKPVDPNELLGTVRELRQARAERRTRALALARSMHVLRRRMARPHEAVS